MSDNKLNNFLSKAVSMKNVIIVLLAFVIILCIVFMYFIANGTLLINGNGTYYSSTISQINALYKQNYIGDMSVFKGNTLTDHAIAAYVASIGDKYAAYLTPEEYKEFQIKSSDNAVGIGVEIVSTPDNKKLLVTSVYPNSPAEAAGLKVGDYLTSVNGKKYTNLGMQKFVREVRGTAGTEATIGYERNGLNYAVKIKRAAVVIQDVLTQKLSGNIEYVKISGFNQETEKQFKKALDETRATAKGYVFDLRNNPGGLLTTVTAMLEDCTPAGTTVTVKFKSSQQTFKSDGKNKLKQPIVVLVDADTCSAAELFSTDMKEMNDAKVLASDAKTFGKGSTVDIVSLINGGGLSLTNGLYYLYNGTNIEGKGVPIDIVVHPNPKDPYGLYYTDKSKDPLVAKAIEILMS